MIVRSPWETCFSLTLSRSSYLYPHEISYLIHYCQVFYTLPRAADPSLSSLGKPLSITLHFALLGSPSPFNLISVCLSFLKSFEIVQKLTQRVGGVSREQPQRNLLLCDPDPPCVHSRNNSQAHFPPKCCFSVDWMQNVTSSLSITNLNGVKGQFSLLNL